MTLDYGLGYWFISRSPLSPNGAHHVPTLILEIKYDVEYADIAGDITQRLPFRISKYSKYVAGVQLLMGIDAHM